MIDKIAKWIFFGVILSLAPLIVDGLNLLSHHQAGTPSVGLPGAVIERGELLLIVAGIAGAALGELFGKKAPRHPVANKVVGGSALFIMFIAAMWYANVAWSAHSGEKYDHRFVVGNSLWLLAATIVVTVACVVLGDE